MHNGDAYCSLRVICYSLLVTVTLREIEYAYFSPLIRYAITEYTDFAEAACGRYLLQEAYVKNVTLVLVPNPRAPFES